MTSSRCFECCTKVGAAVKHKMRSRFRVTHSVFFRLSAGRPITTFATRIIPTMQFGLPFRRGVTTTICVPKSSCAAMESSNSTCLLVVWIPGAKPRAAMHFCFATPRPFRTNLTESITWHVFCSITRALPCAERGSEIRWHRVCVRVAG
jgi:hypothetical protein